MAGVCPRPPRRGKPSVPPWPAAGTVLATAAVDRFEPHTITAAGPAAPEPVACRQGRSPNGGGRDVPIEAFRSAGRGAGRIDDAAGCIGAGAGLAVEADTHDRAVPPWRLDRHLRAAGRRSPGASARGAGGRRQQGRRWRQHRCRARGPRAGGRLHDLDVHRRPEHRALGDEARLRPREGFHADHPDRPPAEHPAGAPVAAGARREGTARPDEALRRTC